MLIRRENWLQQLFYPLQLEWSSSKRYMYLES